MSEFTHICMDCGRGWMTPWRNCCRPPRQTRFAYIGPGHEGFWRWMAHESGMDFEAWKIKFGYDRLPEAH